MTGADEAVMDEFPLFAKLSPALSETGQIMNGPVIGYAKSYDTAAVNSMLNTPQVRMLLPRDVKLMWGVKPIDPAETTYELYAIKANTRDGKAGRFRSSRCEGRFRRARLCCRGFHDHDAYRCQNLGPYDGR